MDMSNCFLRCGIWFEPLHLDGPDNQALGDCFLMNFAALDMKGNLMKGSVEGKFQRIEKAFSVGLTNGPFFRKGYLFPFSENYVPGI